MKKALVLATLFISSLQSFAQEKIPFVDVDEVLELVSKSSDEGDYAKTLEHLNKINKSDSSYCSILTSKSYYLLNSEKYEEVIQTTNEGLSLGCHDTKLSFYINKGLAYNYMEDYDKALKVFNEGLKIFPKNYLLWYNKGVVLESSDRLEDAIKAYQESIVLRPTYIRPHLQLGNICYKQRRITQALMCYDVYLLLKFGDKSAFNTLQSLNNVVKEKNENEPNPDLEISVDDEAFDEIDLIIENRIALNKNYNVDNKINISLTKQNHALLAQIEDFEGNGGFWDQNYVPLFKWIANNNLFDGFTYTLSHSIKNEKLKKIIDQHEKDILDFRNAFYRKWYDILGANTELLIDGKKQKGNYSYNNYDAQGMGVLKNDTNIGFWQFFTENGQLFSEGSHDGNGERIGKWTWYFKNGKINEIANYEGGKLNGAFLNFYDNVKPKIITTYKDGALHGEYKYHNDDGALIQKKFFKNGKLDGLYKSYFKVGEELLEWHIPYANDSVVSVATEYYANGDVYAEIPFKNGKRHGVEKKYHFNKKLSSEISYANGELNGPYKTYFNNGNIEEEGFSKDNFYDSPWKIYHKDGTLKIEQTYVKGSLNDIYKEYDTDGKLYSEFEYRKGEVIAYKYYNKNGEIIKEARKKGGEFSFIGHTPQGTVNAKGLYDIKGGKEGPWEFFSNNGVLTGKGTYKDNMAIGEHLNYYNNGEIESISSYRNDSLTGYYAAYHLNGQLKRQGWNKNGSSVGEWRSYYIDGTLEEINFYHKDDLHGYQETFSVDGKLKSRYLYKYGKVLSETYFNKDGEAMGTCNYAPEASQYNLVYNYENGKPEMTIPYVNGVKHGTFIAYDYYGNISLKGDYNNGEMNGEWIWYYENGKKDIVKNYRDGNLHGELIDYYKSGNIEEKRYYEFGNAEGKWLGYHENGKVSDEKNYYNDKLHGKRKFFSKSGHLQLIRFYEHGRLIGYSYLDTNSKEVPMIPLERETGKIISYFDNGKVSREMEYLNGDLVNNYKEYYYSGQLESEMNFIADKYNGPVTSFYQNGTKKSVFNYQYGVLQGLAVLYHENGKLKEEINYRNDVLHGENKYFDDNGKLVKIEFNHNGDIYKVETF
ncbi:tetratricopeptide repeat protein [Seonamhaeicola sp. ML3]|uniref:tetratricopeptide repeat protein n=1 Tax=Seonamhaeicola sp. ML3 TaxID=2937786 RepID=UPI00200E4BCD|nr:tetratricopeptide repeat protein [Seonamhaeicola sp. ML3]